MRNNITSTARLAPPAGGFQKRGRVPRVSRRVAVTALAVTLLAGAVPEAAAGQGRPELREAMQGFVDIGFAGMQLRVHDERGEWVGSAGVRKLGEPAKPPTNGRFRIGSNTKTFVATVVLQLVAEGKVGLDAPVSSYLPEFGLDRQITVRMMLQHTSGVFNHTGDGYNGTAMPGLPSTGQEWVDNRFHTYQPDELVGDPRIKAGMNIDGATPVPLTAPGLFRPFMFISHQLDSTTRCAPLREDWERDWAQMTGWKRWVEVAGTVHSSFTDVALFANQFGVDLPASTTAERAQAITRAYVNAFFDQHLRGKPSSLLDAPSSRYPEMAFCH